jgi:prefoldin subunit 5
VLESKVEDLLAQRTAELQQKEAQLAVLDSKLAAVAARLEALELHKNPALQITAEHSRGDKRGDVMP